MSSWAEVSPGGRAYAEQFAELAAGGAAVHGEADLIERLAPPGARVLDAGCGTGRVAIRLAERGLLVEGVDADPDMLAVARAAAPGIAWYLGDLTDLSTAVPGPFEVIVAAGNVLPLVADAERAVAGLVTRLGRGGLLVAGFGLDAEHLPIAPTVDLAGYDRWCAAAGLRLLHRWAGWDGEPYAGGGYAVSVHGTHEIVRNVGANA